MYKESTGGQLADQRINKVNISCLEILDNKEQGKGGKFISILCRSRGDFTTEETGPATLLPSGKKLTIRKVEKSSDGNQIAVLKGVHRSDLKRKQLIVPDSHAVLSGREAFFLIPSSKDRMENGNFYVSGGVFPEYNEGNSKPSASLTFHGRVASFRFFYPFPLIPGAKYFIAGENNRDLRTPVTLVYPGKLNQKDGARLAERLLKFGGRPSLKAVYSIILRTDSMVLLPDFMKDENFEGSVRSGRWAIMSREYDRIKNAILKRTASFGGVPEKELAEQIRCEKPALADIISEMISEGLLIKKEGYLINGERAGTSSLSPMASRILEDLRQNEEGVSLSLTSNPLMADTYRALGRLELVKVLDEDIVLHNEQFDRLKREIREKVVPGDELDLAGLKELVPLSRRLLVPLLEEMDREGYFMWKGERRVVLEKE